MDTQSDLEVILEFLEEYYRQNSAENVNRASWPAGVTVDGTCQSCSVIYEPPDVKPAVQPALAADCNPGFRFHDTTATLCESVSSTPSSKHSSRAAGRGSRRKVRLFHFLFEMLEDPSMAHCVSWVPAATGVFRFSSRNKDQVAVLWGLRKGNKRPMTYQKMSRALRNYARSGEIFKVKKKLTYQFSRDTLVSLQRHQHTQH